MATLVLVAGYVWQAGETVTATKLNLAAAPTIAAGQSYTFAAGTEAAPSINFTGGTTTGFYLGSSAIGFSVAGASVGTWSATGLTLGTSQDVKLLGNGNGLLDLSGNRALAIATTGVILAVGGNTVLQAMAGGVTVTGDLIVTNLCNRCSANVVVSASTTLVDLTGCSITVATAGVYAIRAFILMSTTTTGGFHTVFDGTAVIANMRLENTLTYGAAAGVAVVSVSALTGIPGGNTNPSTGTATGGTSIFEGTVEITTGGTLKITVAQNNAAGATTFYKNSYIWAQRIS